MIATRPSNITKHELFKAQLRPWPSVKVYNVDLRGDGNDNFGGNANKHFSIV